MQCSDRCIFLRCIWTGPQVILITRRQRTKWRLVKRMIKIRVQYPSPLSQIDHRAKTPCSIPLFVGSHRTPQQPAQSFSNSLIHFTHETAYQNIRHGQGGYLLIINYSLIPIRIREVTTTEYERMLCNSFKTYVLRGFGYYGVWFLIQG